MYKAVLLWFLLLTHGSLSREIPTFQYIVKTEAQVFFESFSPQDRDECIKFYLAKGLMQESNIIGKEIFMEPEMLKKFVELVEPKNFATNLLQWMRREYQIEDEEIVQIARQSSPCIVRNDRCVRIGDVGSNCCIF